MISNNHKNSYHLNIFVLLFTITIFLISTQLVYSKNNIGCLVDYRVCESYEYCNKDAFIGKCISLIIDDDVLNKYDSKRIEYDDENYSNNHNDENMPIIRHKYENLNENDYYEDDDDDDEEDIENKNMKNALAQITRLNNINENENNETDEDDDDDDDEYDESNNSNDDNIKSNQDEINNIAENYIYGNDKQNSNAYLRKQIYVKPEITYDKFYDSYPYSLLDSQNKRRDQLVKTLFSLNDDDNYENYGEEKIDSDVLLSFNDNNKLDDANNRYNYRDINEIINLNDIYDNSAEDDEYDDNKEDEEEEDGDDDDIKDKNAVLIDLLKNKKNKREINRKQQKLLNSNNDNKHKYEIDEIFTNNPKEDDNMKIYGYKHISYDSNENDPSPDKHLNMMEYIIGLQLGDDYEIERHNRINQQLKLIQRRNEDEDILKFLKFGDIIHNSGTVDSAVVSDLNKNEIEDSDSNEDSSITTSSSEDNKEDKLIDELISTMKNIDEDEKEPENSSSENPNEDTTIEEDIILNVSPKVLEEVLAEAEAEKIAEAQSKVEEKLISEIGPEVESETSKPKEIVKIDTETSSEEEESTSSSEIENNQNDKNEGNNEYYGYDDSSNIDEKILLLALINKDLTQQLTQDYIETENIIDEIKSMDNHHKLENNNREKEKLNEEHNILSPTFSELELSSNTNVKKNDELRDEISDNNGNNEDENNINNKNKNNNDYNDNQSSNNNNNNENMKEKEERFIISNINDNNNNQNEQKKHEQINDSTNNIDDNNSAYPYVHIETEQNFKSKTNAVKLLNYVAQLFNLPEESFQNVSVKNNQVSFILKSETPVDTELFIKELEQKRDDIHSKIDVDIISLGIGKDTDPEVKRALESRKSKLVFIAVVAICVSVSTLLFVLTALYVVKRRSYLRHKLDSESFEGKPEKYHDKSEEKAQLAQDYQELCRQRMQTTSTNSTGDLNNNNNNASQSRVTSYNSNDQKQTDSTRSSTSSWSEEPISTVNMDITTGHIILSYMEEHLNDKSRISNEWEALCKYEPDRTCTETANLPVNAPKNRYSNVLPYDHSRVLLQDVRESDYINASAITDHDPKNAAYIATQGPLVHTTYDFWQMVWEQSSVIIVCLCKTNEYGAMKCSQYWPSNGCEVYDKFEVNLISEHLWCEDYLIRSFYLKNKETNETRTVTQFHFLSWPENDVPQSIKSVLDFRRKVNKSYKGKSCPIVVHCNDGIGRTGTYILIDMVLNRITKGAKEIDIAATLEFLRDQRAGMVTNKSQFEFAFNIVTEELQNMLRVLNPQ